MSSANFHRDILVLAAGLESRIQAPRRDQAISPVQRVYWPRRDRQETSPAPSVTATQDGEQGSHQTSSSRAKVVGGKTTACVLRVAVKRRR